MFEAAKLGSAILDVVAFVQSPSVETGTKLFEGVASLVLAVMPKDVLVSKLDAVEKARIDAEIDTLEAGITAVEKA